MTTAQGGCVTNHATRYHFQHHRGTSSNASAPVCCALLQALALWQESASFAGSPPSKLHGLAAFHILGNSLCPQPENLRLYRLQQSRVAVSN